jgi:predicted nucleic acid-binding protein
MVAAICAWHEHHPRAEAEIARRLRQRERMVVAAPALVEAYAVLTRLPPPHRLSPGDAVTLLEANFMKGATVVALPARSYRDLLRRAPPEGIAGGRVYDAVIAECVRRTREVTLLTFNVGDFQPFVSWGLDVIAPRLS